MTASVVGAKTPIQKKILKLLNSIKLLRPVWEKIKLPVRHETSTKEQDTLPVFESITAIQRFNMLCSKHSLIESDLPQLTKCKLKRLLATYLLIIVRPAGTPNFIKTIDADKKSKPSQELDPEKNLEAVINERIKQLSTGSNIETIPQDYIEFQKNAQYFLKVYLNTFLPEHFLISFEEQTAGFSERLSIFDSDTINPSEIYQLKAHISALYKQYSHYINYLSDTDLIALNIFLTRTKEKLVDRKEQLAKIDWQGKELLTNSPTSIYVDFKAYIDGLIPNLQKKLMDVRKKIPEQWAPPGGKEYFVSEKKVQATASKELHSTALVHSEESSTTSASVLTHSKST